MLNETRLKSAILIISFLLKFICPIVNSIEAQQQQQQQQQQLGVAPVLDIDDEATGYLGTIGERNVLVDLKPHLQIRNIDAINGICSYHVFKPNSEEFPFTIDIKDKTTGEAVIEVIRKEVESTTTTTTATSGTKDLLKKGKSNEDLQPKPKASNIKSILLDCNKRKEYNFLIQAHDCSSPSLPSNKVPVKIEVLDHDDYLLQFEQPEVYKKTLVESDEIYENFMLVKARDNDCTNDGYACSYKIILNEENNGALDRQFPFKIDNSGSLSSVKALKKAESFDFKVRAFDCLNKDSYVDAPVHIDVVEPCVPQWTDYPNEILSTLEYTNLFETLKATSCDQINQSADSKQDSVCQIESVSSKLRLQLDPSIKNVCDIEKCEKAKIVEKPKIVQQQAQDTSSRLVLFTGSTKSDYEDDDSIEDDDDDQNKIVVPSNNLKQQNDQELGLNPKQPPLSYRSFSKVIENAQKIEFDGKFGNDFVLSTWLRRPAGADKSIKEQVFCGTDSQSMNRHHFGLYFYRGSLKFLMRKEPNEQDLANKQVKPPNPDGPAADDIENNEVFYPSLWEWSLYEPILNDNKWHYYEVKFNYPNATLYIDGVHFIENTTNSDIIDAYELNEISGVGPISTYVGACYHARTKSLIDHFEGDIASLVLVKKQEQLLQQQQPVPQPVQQTPQQQQQQSKISNDCSNSCRESLEINMIGNENYLHSIENSNQNEISIQTSNLNDMTQIIRKINYVNKETYPQLGSRSIKLSTSIQCVNNGKQLNLKEVNINLNVKRQKQEYNVQLDGAKQLFVIKSELENGIEPFKEVSILKIPINKIDDTQSVDGDSSENSSGGSSSSSESAENDSSSQQQQESSSVKLSKCQIRILPERNLMLPSQNYEKVMFLQNLLDEFEFDFKETSDLVVISGIQTVENYQVFIRRLTYVITNINEIEPNNLIKNKQFYFSCLRSEPNIETNTILIQLNITRNEKIKDDKGTVGFIAHKQAEKLVVSENEEDILQKKTEDFMFTNSNDMSSPLVVALIVMCSCAIGFLLVFGAIKLHTAGFFNGKRKSLPNEENPQMEWDDSGLNITENPLETLEINKECNISSHQHTQAEYDGDEFSSTDEEDSNDEDDQYSSEEEPEKVVDRELEWDDSSFELKQQLSNKLKSNKSNLVASDLIDTNKFV